MEINNLYKQGWSLYNENKYDDAILSLIKIKREENFSKRDREIYAKSQFLLGYIFGLKKRYEQSEQFYRNVSSEDSIKYYGKAQNNLGLLYEKLNNYELAKQVYTNLSTLGEGSLYAQSQFSLGTLLEKEDTELAIKYYKNVTRVDSGYYYALSRWNIGVLTGNIKYLKNIRVEDNVDLYCEAQLEIGDIEYFSDNPRLNVIISSWSNILVESKFYPKIKYKKHQLEEIVKIKSNLKFKLFSVFKGIDILLNSLIIKDNNESLIAHYTSPTVAKLLIANNVCGVERKNNMRLNTIDLMNDPTEGVILNNFLDILSNLVPANDQAFMGCFTLHHDSLNQFRLYGKENSKEGTGLSLILSEGFFEKENSFSNIRLQNIGERISNGRIEEEELNFNEKKDSQILPVEIVGKLPLYRCIYIDPDSKLIEISHREEWTFCRETKTPKSQEWLSYLEEIETLRKKVRTSFAQLSELIEPLYNKISQDPKKYAKESELLAVILLPLRFLVKHMAFKEEQECRVVYVTQWDDPLIQYDEKLNRFYINYGQDVVSHLKKIYLGPHAHQQKNMFEYLCAHAKQNKRTDHEVKVKVSHNPLR